VQHPVEAADKIAFGEEADGSRWNKRTRAVIERSTASMMTCCICEPFFAPLAMSYPALPADSLIPKSEGVERLASKEKRADVFPFCIQPVLDISVARASFIHPSKVGVFRKPSGPDFICGFLY
jgi:hypothetical protein